jgi:hypothetical protein
VRGQIFITPKPSWTARTTPRLQRAVQEATEMREDPARRQLASASAGHFLFVPITIGLAFLTALTAGPLTAGRQHPAGRPRGQRQLPQAGGSKRAGPQ